MTNEITFKTSEECRCELVAHTVMKTDTYFEQALGWVSPDDPDAGFLPVSAARASFQNEDKTGLDAKKDLKLMGSLTRDGHVGPFEHNHATFIIECPLFIRSQIMRHRTGAYNEWSRRYTSEKIGFWVPDKWRAQSKSNKQASTDDEVAHSSYVLYQEYSNHPFNNIEIPKSTDHYVTSILKAISAYETLLSEGASREQARAVLPQSLLTQFYMTMNLRNWVHFLKLRLDSHAQKEVQIVARKIESQLRELWPEAMGVLLPLEETN